MRSRRALIAGAATAALVLSACGGGGDAEGVTSFDIAVSNASEPYSIPWLVGKDQGLFERRGVTIGEIVPGKGGGTTVRNMLSGDLPIADVGFTSVLESSEAGTPVTVVGGATQSVYGLDFYTLDSNAGVRTINDVRNWAYTNPQSVTQALSYILPRVAGATQEIERTSSGGLGEGVALLEAGSVDVAVVPPSVVAKTDKFRVVVSSADYLKKFQQSVITTTPEFAERNPDTVKAVLAGYQDAVEFIRANPQKAAELYADYIDIDVAAATTIVNKTLQYDNWSAGFDAEAIEQAVEAQRLAMDRADLPFCELFRKTYLPANVPATLPAECGAAQ
ncbi:ABC transporter substrate-binding protein [Amycolatopsis endophytica]|uniref:NitT/TauT family transport system substrate-binding protein n=1 Tax=Amycolatopsis endophytica TaxID=860233 RepID=A0A853B966_9PSEU|nr:ABC transporter substrate-binding protein [Amycolatopsis endophytica]NYI91314.1 NitT/TauT family transport system substrate-binding protein [Amycolatopsis endophytica]